MSDISIIALAGVIGFIVIALCIIWGTIIYKQDNFRFKSDTNIKTDLQNGKIDAEISVDLEGKNVKEKDGIASQTLPSSSKQQIK